MQATRTPDSRRGQRPFARAGASRPPHEEFIMQILVKGHQVEVTPALRDYAVGKFERVSRHFDHLHEFTIVLGVEKLLHKAEATILVSGKTLHADATAVDMYAAIDALVDKVDTQVRKHKEKLTDHHADAVRSARYS
jgi:putative sigma-54 modulation protein